MTPLDAPLSTLTISDETPLYAETWVDVTLAALFAPLKAAVGMTPPAPKPARLPRVHLTERRRAVYDASMLVWLYAAGA